MKWLLTDAECDRQMVDTLPGILYIGVMVYLASYQQATGKPVAALRWMMNGLVGLMGFLGLSVLLQAVLFPQESYTAIAPFPALLFAGLCGLAMAAGFSLINSLEARERLARMLTRSVSHDELSEKSSAPRYNPNSGVHTAAVVLAIFAPVYYTFIFVLAGGMEGIARALTATPPTMSSMFMDFTINTLLALLGVGLFIRRDISQTMERLGLKTPGYREVLVAIAAGIGLFIVANVTNAGMSFFIPAEILDLWDDSARALLLAFSDALLLKGVFLALVYGISEEILYRGALQPVFGIVPVALFFALMHLQYMFTPLVFIIFGVALCFGWIRQRYGTTAAIIAHIVYDFLPFLLAALLPGVV